jgi:hypothetical protein
MPIKPKTLEGIGTEVLYPLASLKLKIMNALTEAKIPNIGKVPYKIKPNVIESLKKRGITSPVSLGEEITKNPVQALKKIEPALSNVYSDILNNVVVRNGKLYGRVQDSNLNSLYRISADQFSSVPDNRKDFINALNSVVYGRPLVGKDKFIDIANNPFQTAHMHGLSASSFVGKAMDDVGSKLRGPVIMNTGTGLYTKPSAYNNVTGEIILNNPGITTPTHELFHAKDYKQNPVTKKLIKNIGEVLAATALVGTPASILYGKKVSDYIPGSVDDAIINAYKYAGPEMWLAGKLMGNYPEFYATKNTKRVIRENPKYFETLGAAYGIPSSANDISTNQDVKARTYPSSMATKYGLLRLGTLPLYLSKESSAAVNLAPSDYAAAIKDRLFSKLKSIKGLATGSLDAELWKGLLYHDSANKYKRISGAVPVTLVAALAPLVALGEYYRGVNKPPQFFPGQDYDKDIKQGLGA